MAELLWKRFAKVTFGKRGEEGKSISGLDLNFSIEKNIGADPNKGTISIFNMNEDSRGVLSQAEDLFISLEVGYGSEEDFFVLFLGDVIRANSSKKAGDWVTKIECGDGQKDLKKSNFSKSYKKGVSTGKILQDIIDTFDTVTFANPERFTSRKLEGSLVIDGDVTKALNKIINQQNLTWSVQDEVLRIVSPYEVLDDQVVYLSPSSGLIESPFSQDVSVINTTTPPAGQKKKQNVKVSGIKFKSLIIPNILPARAIEIKSRYIEGVFRCQKVMFSGSTFSNNWYASVDAIPFGDSNE